MQQYAICFETAPNPIKSDTRRIIMRVSDRVRQVYSCAALLYYTGKPSIVGSVHTNLKLSHNSFRLGKKNKFFDRVPPNEVEKKHDSNVNNVFGPGVVPIIA